MERLTQHEHAAIKRVTARYTRNEPDTQAEQDFRAACRELLLLLGVYWPLLDAYLELLELDVQSDDAEDAFLRGKADRKRGTSWAEGLTAYISGRQSRLGEQLRQESLDLLVRIMSSLVPFSAIEELTLLYRMAYGFYRRHIDLFYCAGYEYAE